jgi:ActR/RegA family two-component response regulator
MARTFAALLVDSDLKGLESLVYGFHGVSWRSTACAAPETAAFLIKESVADIAVIAARAPYDKTLTLLRQLRASEETRTLPLLVIGPASLRPSVLECGSINFLPTPAFVRDVIAACRILVSLGGHDAQAQGGEGKIDGSLADFGFFSLIRVMSGLLLSGVLQLERANRRGEILFSEGELAGAQVGSLQGPPAIHHLLLWEDAKIELRLRAVVRRTQFNQRFDQIMDEAERFVRDFTHAIQGIGPASSVYGKDEDQLAKAMVPSDVTPVLRLCDGRRTLTDIIDESPFRVFDTVRILTRLADLGGLTRCKPQDGSPAPTPPLEKFWETARIASSEDSLALPLSQRPTPLRVGQADVRSGEPNRRKSQRRAAIQTPALGTPVVGRAAAGTLAAGAPDTAAALVAQAAGTREARASGSIDVSVTGDRRQAKPDRRNRPSVTIDVALMEAAPSPAPPAAAPVEAAPTKSLARSGRVTGTLQVAPASGQRRSNRDPRVAGSGNSIVIDPGLPSETSSTATMASPAVPRPQSVTPAASSGAAQAVTARTRPSDGASSARMTGTLSVTPAQRSGSAKTMKRGVSVELDPVLAAELGRLEKATTPIGPPTSAEPLRAGPGPVARAALFDAGNDAPPMEASASPKSGQAARVTGTLSVSSSSRSSANARKTPGRGVSVSLDPAMVAEVQELEAPKPQSPTVTPHGLGGATEPRTASQGAGSGKGQVRGTSGDRTAPAAARPTPRSSDDSASQPGKRTGGRISGAFSAIESDFFAREADLYKREAEDNFADLDEPARKRDGKISPGRGPSKKHA